MVERKQSSRCQCGGLRLYRIKANGQIEPVTLDDNPILAHYAGEKGLDFARGLQHQVANSSDHTKLSNEAKTYNSQKRIISQALGTKPEEYTLEPSVYIVDLEPGDKLLFTSDGIHDNLLDGRIGEVASSGNDPNEISRNLVAEARASGRKIDDMTAVVVVVEADRQAGSLKFDEALAITELEDISTEELPNKLLEWQTRYGIPIEIDPEYIDHPDAIKFAKNLSYLLSTLQKEGYNLSEIDMW